MSRCLPACLVLLLCACSYPSAGGTGPDASSGVALSEYCTATADATCRANVTCGAVPESQLDACIRIEASICDLDRLIERVESRRVTYDGDAYRRCLDRVAATQLCDDGRRPVLPTDDPDCIQAARGRIEPGDSCGQGEGPLVERECADGVCSGYGCSGLCRALSQLGDSCTTRPCDTGLQCLDGTCQPLAGAGEACERYRASCDVGLFCQVTGDGTWGTCLAPLPLGASCRRSDVCVPGAHCPDGDRATCVAWAGAGAPCTEVPDDCRAGFRCAAGTCVPQEPRGGTCRLDGDCLYPATCDDETHVCVLQPVVGESCTTGPGSIRCATGWCDGTTCRPMVAPGETCTHDFECSGPETWCQDGRCVPWGDPTCGG